MFTFGGTKKAGSAAGGTADDLVHDVTTQSFVKDVIEESKAQPVLVDFWAPWCGPCKQLTPVLEKVVRAARGKVKLAKMNIDEHPAVAGQLGIQSIPAVIAFVDGRPVDGFMGALPEGAGDGLHRAPRPRPSSTAPRSCWRPPTPRWSAATRWRRPMPSPPCWPRSRRTSTPWRASPAAISNSATWSRPRTPWRWCRPAKANDPAVAAARAAIEVAEQAAELGDLAELEAAVAANSANHQARFDLALALNARGRRAEAVEPPAGDRQARPHLERGRRPQAAGDLLRGVGAGRSAHHRRPPPAVLHPVCVRRGRDGQQRHLPRPR